MVDRFELVKVVRGGKVTIPREIRKALCLRDGDYLAVRLDSDGAKIVYFPVSIKPVNRKS